jgi:phosphatidate cytidylyltransferase
LARPAPDARGGELRRRVLSAAILIPATLLAVHLGGIALAALMIAAAGMLGWEWSRLCGFAVPHMLGVGLVCGLVLIVAGAQVGGGHGAVVAWTAVAAGVIAGISLLRRSDAARWRWFAAGVVYLGVPCVALLWLRTEGADHVFWLLCVTWAADIGAFFAGRAIGGPRLAPAISPNKTWSGFAGGMVAACRVGAAFGMAFGTRGGLAAAAAAIAVALAAVVGDLVESGLKRRFGAKDAGNLIPGHGGVLDRVDSLLLAAPAAALLLILDWRWL